MECYNVPRSSVIESTNSVISRIISLEVLIGIGTSPRAGARSSRTRYHRITAIVLRALILQFCPGPSETFSLSFCSISAASWDPRAMAAALSVSYQR